jgi:S-adenosylmethionine-diacylglycerol 3-amino-3-carboxypropyl transferase
MGSRPSNRRGELLDKAIALMPAETAEFWRGQRAAVIAHGAGGVGKFERYFRIFRKWLLPLVHSRRTISDIFQPRTRDAREVFLRTRFNTWRWRLLLKIFFSRTLMGRMGRDQAFFDHVDGSVSAHVARRIRHAAVDCDPSQNPYLHWIMTGTHGAALPMPWRAEHYATIRARLGRLELRHGPLEAFGQNGERADGYNLSDIFEYMPPDIAGSVYGELLGTANAGARLVYWNMMAPRRVPAEYADHVRTLQDLEDVLKAQDKAFFYSDFVIEEVTG